MATNIFDQFDAPQKVAGNIFDQFDAPQAPAESRIEAFAQPKLPKQAPAPAVKRQGFFISEYDDGSFGPGSVTKPIVDGIRNALPAAANYQPGTGDEAGADKLIQQTMPLAAAFSPATAGTLGRAGAGAAMPPVPKRLSADELRTAAKAAYQEADQAGVIFSPVGVKRVLGESQQALAEFGYHPALQPRIKVALDELSRMSEGNVTYKGMDTLRKITRSAAQSNDPSERALGGMLVERIDDLMANSRAFETISGNPEQASGAIKEARNLWRRLRATEMIDEAVGKAERRAASTGSGGNVNNATRQNLRVLLDNPKKARLFTEQERQAIDSIVRGTGMMNTLRQIGKMSPEGNGLMMTVSGGLGAAAVVSHPALAIPPAMGFVAKRLADRGMAKSVDRLMAMVSTGKRNRVVESWNDVVSRYRQGNATEAALRNVSIALARQLATGGDDEKAIHAELMQAAQPE